MKPDFNLSPIALEIALMGMAFTAGNMAASKCLAEINEEKRAAAGENGTVDGDGVVNTGDAPSIDRFSDFANALDAPDKVADHTEEIGYDRPVSFVEWCVFLAALNDAIEKLSKPTGTGRRWPMPQTVESILLWKTKITPQPVQATQYDDMRILVAANLGLASPAEVTLTDDQLRAMAVEENQAKAVFFASLFETNRDEIKTRMEAGIANYNRFSETTWETIFANFPPKVQYTLLGSVDMRIDSKITELFTGRRRDGTLSPGATRPAIQRASDMVVLRKDLEKVKGWREGLESRVDQ